MLDVLVIGGGNAALCAAMAACDEGARRVKILEVAPRIFRGGNSRHTRNYEFACQGRREKGLLPSALFL